MDSSIRYRRDSEVLFAGHCIKVPHCRNQEANLLGGASGDIGTFLWSWSLEISVSSQIIQRRVAALASGSVRLG